MEKYAFRMQLKPGCAAEYQRRHDEIWPELTELLKSTGISDYSIHLDPDTLVLFAVLWRKSTHSMERLPLHPLMRRWWAYMADLMLTNSGGEPLAVPLETVFHLL